MKKRKVVDYPEKERFLIMRRSVYAICNENEPAYKLLSLLLFYCENYEQDETLHVNTDEQQKNFSIRRTEIELCRDLVAITVRTLHDVAIPMLQAFGYLDIADCNNAEGKLYVVHLDAINAALAIYKTQNNVKKIGNFLCKQLEKFLIQKNIAELETFPIELEIFPNQLEKFLITIRKVSNSKRGRPPRPKAASTAKAEVDRDNKEITRDKRDSNTISLDSVEKGEKKDDFSSTENLQNDEWRIADEEQDDEKTEVLQAVEEITIKRQAVRPPAPPVAPPPAPASSKPSQPQQKEVPPQSPPTTRNANKNTRSKTDNPPKQAALPIVLSDGASLVWNGWSGMYWFKNAAPRLTETAASRSEELGKAGLGTIGLDALEEIKQIVAFGQKRFKDRYANRGFELGDIVWLRPKWLSSRPAVEQTPSPSSSSNNTPSAPQTPKNEAERIMMEDEQKFRSGLILWTLTVDENLQKFLKTPRSDYDVWCNLTAAIKWEWMTQEEALAHAWPKHRGFTDRERRSILEAQRRRENQQPAA